MKFLFTLTITFFSILVSAQEFPYKIELIEVGQSNDLQLQSFAVGEWNGQVFLFGGRIDGLHQRQPFASFAASGMNSNITVLNLSDFSTNQISLSSLSTGQQEQLSSTNMQFTQVNNLLVVTGGYGYSNSLGDHVTYPRLTIIDLEILSNAIDNNLSIQNAFTSIEDETFAVTGGALRYMSGTYYLIGGHRFDGRYNPMNGPSFTQVYHEKIVRFQLVPNQNTWSVIVNSEEWTDSSLLHRRDLNVLPGFDLNGEMNLTMFTGVFQPVADLPWLNSVEVTGNGFSEIPNFSQLLSQYHCGSLSLKSQSQNKQHYVFLGGIAEYYMDNSMQLVQNTDVPFTNNISCVTRTAGDAWIEEVNSTFMPGYLGAGAEVVLNSELPVFENGVIDFDALTWTQDSVSLGYLIGGIESTAQNIFWINDGSQSQPNKKIYEIWLINEEANAVLNFPISDESAFRIYPNPSNGKFKIEFKTFENCAARLKAFDSNGKLVAQDRLGNFQPGQYAIENNWKLFQYPGMYLLQLQLNNLVYEQRLLIEP
jgi:Secretion system C-terminal sorting domain